RDLLEVGYALQVLEVDERDLDLRMRALQPLPVGIEACAEEDHASIGSTEHLDAHLRHVELAPGPFVVRIAKGSQIALGARAGADLEVADVLREAQQSATEAAHAALVLADVRLHLADKL